MKLRLFTVISILSLMAFTLLYSNPPSVEAANNNTLKVVGLYSETTAGSISYRVEAENWKVVKVGDQIRIKPFQQSQRSL